MGTFKNAKVVMLPTNQKATVNSIVTRPSDNRMAIVNVLTVNDPQPSIHHHIYIVSDEIINDGDWYMNGKYIYQADRHYQKANNDKKIIATTDCLEYFTGEIVSNRYAIKKQIPKPSKAFIEKFVDSYNKNIVIDNVLVEYEEYDHDEEWSDIGGAYETFKERVKVNPKDNTITIKKSKDTFTRKEVIVLLNKLNETLNIVNTPEFEGEITLEDWINKNI